jgi:hypothetical protein
MLLDVAGFVIAFLLFRLSGLPMAPNSELKRFISRNCDFEALHIADNHS